MELPRTLTLGIGRSLLHLKKQSPHIFFAAGVVGAVTSTVLACRATLKLSETLDEIQVEVEDVKKTNEVAIHSAETIERDLDEYTQLEHNKDLIYVYIKSGLKVTRLYGPAILVGAASVAALTGSHIQLTRRNAALMAAYAAVQKAYDDYRERVREQLGEERELDLYRAAKTEIAKVDGKNQEVTSVDPNKWSPYAKMFDDYNPHFKKDPEYNRMFIQCQQNYANTKLRAVGHVFLNEVYDSLGFERTRAGAVVGWVIGPDGDNYVDFGIFEPSNSLFLDGCERSIMLDFNVDGVIYDKI